MAIKRGYPEEYFTPDAVESPQAPRQFYYKQAAVPTQELLPYPYVDTNSDFKWLIAGIIALGFFGLLAVLIMKDK